MEYLNTLFVATSLKSWQKANLDYNWYWFLAVFFGVVGLDHLYLGSPLTAGAKLAVNTSTFGYWYIYDAIRATGDQQTIKFAGPAIPGLGFPGIAAGRFQRPDAPISPESKGKHANVFIYTLVLFALGLIGGDSFLVGDTLSGLMRLCFLFTIILAPISIIWYVYKMYAFVVKPQEVFEQNWNYFDFPRPSNIPPCNNMFAQLFIWLLQTIRGILSVVPGINLVVPLLDSLIQALRVSYGMAAAAVNEIVSGDAADKARMLFDDSMSKTVPNLASLSEIRASLPGNKSCQQGGGDLVIPDTTAPLALFLSLTIGLIIVSAVTISLRRAYQNTDVRNDESGRDEEAFSDVKRRGKGNDVPPEPTTS
jgi:TM2 domain-containing membrane protein YozV